MASKFSKEWLNSIKSEIEQEFMKFAEEQGFADKIGWAKFYIESDIEFKQSWKETKHRLDSCKVDLSKLGKGFTISTAREKLCICSD